jgi:hypothetical protein
MITFHTNGHAFTGAHGTLSAQQRRCDAGDISDLL